MPRRLLEVLIEVQNDSKNLNYYFLVEQESNKKRWKIILITCIGSITMVNSSASGSINSALNRWFQERFSMQSSLSILKFLEFTMNWLKKSKYEAKEN